MQQTKKTMGAFAALSEAQQKAVIGGQGTVEDLSNAIRRFIDTVMGNSPTSGAGNAGSAAGSIGSGAVKP